MPTEHEYKYVISLDFDESKMPVKECDKLLVRQGYLAFSKGMTTRIRSVMENHKEKWFLTFKQKVDDRVIEIEKKLDHRDGKDLWKVCVGKLKKHRYVYDNSGITWEIDFFYRAHHVYFILAEVELEEGAARPKSVPDFLKNYVLYEVPLTDDAFSNKRLGDVEYATNMYDKLQRQKQGDQQ